MVIWILNPFDDVPSEGKPQRYWRLCESLADLGHDVVWWTSTFSHRRKASREFLKDDGLNFELRGVECPAYQKNISIARIKNHREWGQQLIEDATTAVRTGELLKPDLVIASMPPMEGPMAALKFKELYGCKVVTDVMDAWPETLLQAMPNIGGLGRGVGNLVLRPYWKMLRQAMAGSDAISAQSESFASYARSHGFSGLSHVCYLGADPIEGESVDRPVGAKVLRLVYIGAMGRSYDLFTLIDAVRVLIESGSKVELHVAGGGEKLERMRQLSQGWGDGVVHFHDYLQREALAELLQACDVGVIPMYPAAGVTIPYKAGDYLSAGLPIINSLEGELENLLKSPSCGVSYVAGDCSSLVQAISHFITQSSADLFSWKENARNLFQSRFDRESTYPKFARWLATLSG